MSWVADLRSDIEHAERLQGDLEYFASQPEGVVVTRVASRARPMDSLHICAPMEHEVGCLWAQAAEEVDGIKVEVRGPPNSAIAMANAKIVRAFRICFSR
jgi:hypothetical protein